VEAPGVEPFEPGSEILRHHKDLRPMSGHFAEFGFGVWHRFNPLRTDEIHPV
jgi:hypothetical protein